MRSLRKGVDQTSYSEALALLEDQTEEVARVIDALVSQAEKSKAARKGVAAAIDHSHQRGAVRRVLAERAGEDDEGSTERLLRRARRADEGAQVRRNPIRRNEGFLCAGCGATVPPAPGGGVRNHCPECLCSLHVDGLVPGDRASDCHGLMRPREFAGGAEMFVLQVCERCGHRRRNRLHPEWADAPDRIDPALLSRP